jgi:hypothetical protein
LAGALLALPFHLSPLLHLSLRERSTRVAWRVSNHV